MSFYPRLSGALSCSDSSPEAERLYVREAMKVRRLLMNGLKDKLEAVNDLTMVQGDSTLQSKSVVHSSLRALYTPV